MSSPPLDATSVAALIEDAATAPSMHNAQPWKFRYLRDSGSLQVRADVEHAIPKADPANRALHLGCGAALFNLRVAAAHAGREPVTTLLPDPADPWLLAEVGLSRLTRPDDDLAVLHPAIRRRHTSRFPFTDEEIPTEILDELRSAAILEGVRLYVPEEWHVQSVLNLIHDAEGREALDPSKVEETSRWTGTGAEDDAARTEGIPAYAFGPRQRDVTAPVRDFAGRRLIPGRDSATFETRPRIALLGTATDRPTDWLRAGQAMERVLLQATLDGLVTSLTSHALEWPELRWAVRDPESAMAHVQMVIRLGYGPAGPATPRRPVSDVLDIV
ncbi:nitroreductase family protein [Streptomyces lunaelactis]|uniref:Acg family FMN-binding oxidoreductase n=1 Tax=Streptomyces lunaelactis TaxID=1535768 RepID=UPI001585C587|nr:nitroreductase family protein [Streptomyces lunaelactis]NUK23147.1 nitroreductase family protein [Streptomyces lunaelactis]NUK53797.1 nitroreductase family protein [Streptomyces lunaelactis]NUK56860.1 nitroreductase family protein [Streptomyces lunaelactis]NUK67721.1 nitroreductase family protein [Streptomyces lunaelactis]